MQTSSRPVALVTQAAGYAGPAAVAALLAADFRVLVHDRAFEQAQAWEAFGAEHPGAERLQAEQPAQLAAAAWERAGRVDALISNDHYPALQAATAAVSSAALRQTLEALVVAPFELLQAAIPRLQSQGGGNIVMITSCRTRLPIAGAAIPDAARAAANALVRSLAVELAPHDIAVNAVAPNYYYSEAYYPRATFIDAPHGRAYVETAVPARRLGRPEEMGEVVRFLATTRARFLTGAILDFAGGWPASPARPMRSEDAVG